MATQGSSPEKRERTALPSGLAIAASWNPDLAFTGGQMIGDEARRSGFNVMLAGGVNLLREPRNGRNFEYAGEDPWLAGVMVAAEIEGIQSNHIISTVKHFALNDQEKGRFTLNAKLPLDAARMSDLLAFEIAIERSAPGAVMCAYNLYEGDYACENALLLDHVLKRRWNYPGFVMSDWGAVHSTAKAANAGFDQESASSFDSQEFFAAPLSSALAEGSVAPARLDDMVRRILTAEFATGLADDPVAIAPIDYDAHARITRRTASEGMVLLKNERQMLPLAGIHKLAVIGGHADVGVIAGGGSSLVYPRGGNAVPGLSPQSWPGPVVFDPSSPLRALRARLPGVEIIFDSGADPAAAAALARSSDAVLLFVTQWSTEDRDHGLDLPDGQDALVTELVAANKNLAVVIESGGPVLMPWNGEVAAILAAWYPGTEGGEAIADILTGMVNPSGHLPASFPRSVEQLPRKRLDGPEAQNSPDLFDVTYQEGAAVGYKWYDLKQLDPLFPFGFGLSYTRFSHQDLAVSDSEGQLRVEFTVKNEGNRAGQDVAQIYVGRTEGGWEAPRRLAGFAKLALDPGEARRVSISIDPRLLAVYRLDHWEIAPGRYDLFLGSSARDLPIHHSVTLAKREFGQ